MPRTLTARRRSPVDVDVARASALALARRIDTSVSAVLREGAKWGTTLADIGRAARCRVAQLVAWMRAESRPSSRDMQALAAALGVTLSYLSLDWRSGDLRAGIAGALLVAELRVRRKAERTNGSMAKDLS